MFTTIVKDAKVDKQKPKRWSYVPIRKGVEVYSPYNGLVTNVSESKGMLKIKLSDKLGGYIFKVYDVDRIIVSEGESVVRGQLIGFSSEKQINIEVTDKYNREQDISQFFIGYPGVSSTEQKTKPEKNINKIDKKSFGQDKKPIEKEKTKIKKKEDYSNVPSFSMLDVGLLPLHALKSGWNWLTKKKDDEVLEEEIKRIKQLLK